MAYQLGALGAIKTPELVKMSKPTSGNYSQLFGQMNRNQQALGQREDRATLNALGSARAEAIMDGQGGSAELQGIREAQTKALDAQDIPLYDKLTGDLKAQMQIESAEAKADPLGKNQMLRKRAENVGRRGVTGNAQSIQTAIKAQAPFETKLNILENELNSMSQNDPGFKEKFAEYQTVIGEHDSLAFNEGQKWYKKGNTRKTIEEIEDDKRSQEEHNLKLKSYTGKTYNEFRDNWQKNNKDLRASSEVAKGITPLITSASKGNAQAVATIVKRMSRIASNEAIVMPELQLGFDASVEGKVDSWADQFIGSGNRIPERDLRNIKEAYNAMISDYNDRLEDSIKDGISDWKSVNPKAKKQSTAKLTRQMMGRNFNRIPDWTDVISYKKLNSNPKDKPNTSEKRDEGEVKSPDGLTDRERLDADLLKLMEGD